MMGVNAVKLVKAALCEEVMWDLKNLKEQVFIIMRLQEHFIKYKGPGACMVCAPRSRALPVPCSPKPWGHREWVYSSASLKMLSLAMASKEEKICFLLLSHLGEFSLQIFCGFIKLNQKEFLNRSIALENWIRSQLEVWLLGAQPTSPAHLWQNWLYLLPLLKTDPGTYHFQRYIMVLQPRVHG